MGKAHYPNHGDGKKSMPNSFKPPQVRTSMPGRTGQVESKFHTSGSGGHPVARYPMDGAPKGQKTSYP